MARKQKAADFSNPIAFTLGTLFDMRPSITQTYLADMCGVTRQTVSNWLDGTSVPDANAIWKICTELNVSADYLLGTEGTGNITTGYARKYFELVRKLNEVMTEVYR